MKNYTLKSQNRVHSIVENATGLTVYKTKVKGVARSMYHSLNCGSGFNGFTPTFFTQTEKASQ